MVLDPFSGVGRAGVVAVKRGLRFIGIDLNSDYLALGAQQIQAVMDESPLLFAERR